MTVETPTIIPGYMFLGYGEDLRQADLQKYRDQGYRLHHAVEWRNGEKIRDDWYAADPEWVRQYHASGGQWSYRD